jgi:non-ribosomal peptide synthetase component E (peptide arylation enzyme)
MGRSILMTEEMICEYKKKGYWEDTTLTEYYDRNAGNHPRKEGVIDVKNRLTWPDVKRLSDYMAVNLLERGFKKGDVILAQLYNCVELYLTLIACHKIGIITAMPRPTFREKEVHGIAKTIEPVAVITLWKYRNFDHFGMLQEISKSVPSIKHHFVMGDAIPEKAVPFKALMDEPPRDKLKNMEDLLRAKRPSAFEVHMILTTSGTTGIPKCLEYTQAPQIWSGRVVQKRWEITAEDVIGVFFHLSGGTAHLTGIVPPAILGTKVVLLPHWSPQEACELIAREKITVATLAPAQLAALLNDPDIGKYDLRSLRVLHTTTALLPFALAKEAEERLGVKCVQTYGSIDGGSITCTPIHDPIEKRVGSVGIPYDGGDVRVVDESGEEVPQGCMGKLSIGLSPVAQGSYYGKPEVTSKIWHGGRKNQEDLVKKDDQGRIVLLGRTQEVINRGGEKIFPKEIEDTMRQHPAVSECALVKMPDPIMGEKACLCIVLSEGKSLCFEEMKDCLKEKQVANFKIPERLEILEELPLVPGSYKIDKKTLEQRILLKLGEKSS